MLKRWVIIQITSMYTGVKGEVIEEFSPDTDEDTVRTQWDLWRKNCPSNTFAAAGEYVFEDTLPYRVYLKRS